MDILNYSPEVMANMGNSMNEQIRELMQQADSLARAIEPDLKESARYNRIRDEKFAELIVRECATLAFDGPNGILEHFGVEE